MRRLALLRALPCFILAAASAACCLPCMFTPRKSVPPPPGATYDVIGRREGLRGYVVSYSDSLYRGGAPTDPRGLSSLKALGIRSIISICPTRGLRRWTAEKKLVLVEIPFGKGGPAARDRAKFLKAVRDLPKPVYLHCKTGAHRAAALAILYRTRVGGWPFESALHEFLRLGGDERKDAALIESVKK